MNNTDLIPNVSVGPIKLGEQIGAYLHFDYTFYEKDVGDEYMESFYEFSDPPLIVFVNGRDIVTTINCEVSCFYKGKNLIRLPFDGLVELIGMSPDRREKIYLLVGENKGQNQYAYDFESLGLQIWTWRNKIVTISCANYDLDF